MALNSAICLFSSYWLKLGYYAPCFAGLAEPCGGELNAALAQTGAFAALGAVLELIDLAIVRGKTCRRSFPDALMPLITHLGDAGAIWILCGMALALRSTGA